MTTTSTGDFTVTYSQLPSKKQIIERLFNDKHISFEEMWILAQEPVAQYQPIYIPPYIPDQPQFPTFPTYPPIVVYGKDLFTTSSSANDKGHN